MASYREAGVDRDARAAAKQRLDFSMTHQFASGPLLPTAYNTLYPCNGAYHVKTVDTVGTKVMLAQLAGRHDTIGVDAVAMVVNDAIRCGAMPHALTNFIVVQRSDPDLLASIGTGLARGATEAMCPMVGGEVADVSELLAQPYDLGCDCVGAVRPEEVITGSDVRAGDAVIGLPSSGLHSNGISLARKTLFKQWGGAWDTFDQPDGIDRELILEALEPTRIYVKDFSRLQKAARIRAAIHITGDAYLKFSKLQELSGVGFSFDHFKPHGIFSLIQSAGRVTAQEMFSTFNMGWGFAVVVRKEDEEDALRAVRGAEVIGTATPEKAIRVSYAHESFAL